MQTMTRNLFDDKRYRRTILSWYYGMPDLNDILSFIGKVFDYIKNRFYLVRNVGFVIRGFSPPIKELSVPP